VRHGFSLQGVIDLLPLIYGVDVGSLTLQVTNAPAFADESVT
jgi:hypothetical protein